MQRRLILPSWVLQDAPYPWLSQKWSYDEPYQYPGGTYKISNIQNFPGTLYSLLTTFHNARWVSTLTICPHHRIAGHGSQLGNAGTWRPEIYSLA